MKRGVVCAELADIGQHRCFRCRKPIAHPKRYRIGFLWFPFPMVQNDLAALFGIAMEHGWVAEIVCQGFIDKLRKP